MQVLTRSYIIAQMTTHVTNFVFLCVCFSAVFVKISVRCNERKLRSQKTPTEAQSLVTVFNDVLVFPLPELPLLECKIVVSVYNTHPSKGATRHLVGQFTVGRSNNLEDEHWRSMMHSIRQPVARWHGLLI